jgi:hypothetical protein
MAGVGQAVGSPKRGDLPQKGCGKHLGGDRRGGGAKGWAGHSGCVCVCVEGKEDENHCIESEAQPRSVSHFS